MGIEEFVMDDGSRGASGAVLDQPDSSKMVDAVRRYRGLSEENRQDFDEMFEELARVRGTEDERGTILYMVRLLYPEELEGCYELDEADAKIKGLDLTDSGVSQDYQKWIKYVSGKIRVTRKAKGLTQAELAAASGLPQPHISKLENGIHSPSHLTLQKLAKALGVTVGHFDPTFPTRES